MTNMHDSGKRQSFGNGAVRDTAEGKPRPDLISPHANLREGVWLGMGALKYAERNWEAGIPISRCIASLERHLLAYKLGLRDEDHAAAIRTNAGFIIHYEEEIAAGRMGPKIDDMPHYEDRPILPGICEDEEAARAAEEEELRPTDVPGAAAARTIFVSSRSSDKPQEEYGRALTEGPACAQNRRGFYLIRDAGGPLGVCCAQCSWGSHENPRATIYIAGPMRGLPMFNFPAFDEATEWWRSRGYTVISPAEMDREHGFDPNQSVSPADMREAIERDVLKITDNLQPATADGIALLPEWEKSRGAAVEVALGLFLGLKFYDACTGEQMSLTIRGDRV